MVVAEPTKSKTLRSAAESMGFTTTSYESIYVTPAKLYTSTKDGHTEGDVYIPEKTVDAYILVGYRTEARLGFEATFTPQFTLARVLDPVGRFRELKVDYSISNDDVKKLGYNRAHADKLAAQRDAEYNDGAQIMQYEWYIHTATEFYFWVDEWMRTLKSDHKPLSAKPRAPKKTKQEVAVEREADLLSGGEWSA